MGTSIARLSASTQAACCVLCKIFESFQAVRSEILPTPEMHGRQRYLKNHTTLFIIYFPLHTTVLIAGKLNTQSNIPVVDFAVTLPTKPD